MSLSLEEMLRRHLHSPTSDENSRALASITIETLKFQNIETKRSIIDLIIDELPPDREHSLCKEIKALTKSHCWKDGLLGSNRIEIVKIKYPFIAYSNTSLQPIEPQSRFAKISSQAIVGSTFLTNFPERLSETGNHILDGAYGASCLERNVFSGYALALGDGAGGHFGDAAQDRRISRASYFASKGAVRLLSTYHSADQLKKEIPSIINALKREIVIKAKGEGTTLTACRIFPSKKGFRLIGFNIGDSCLLGFHPLTKSYYPLLLPRVSELGTAIFPTAYRTFEIDTIDQEIPNHTLLFLLSDGMHDLLPAEEEEKQYENGLCYRIKQFKEIEKLFQSLPENGEVEIYIEKLKKEACQRIEILRKEADQKMPIQLGDDFLILGCQIKISAPFTTMLTKIKNIIN